jgi:hypothetical protein
VFSVSSVVSLSTALFTTESTENTETARGEKRRVHAKTPRSKAAKRTSFRVFAPWRLGVKILLMVFNAYSFEK